MVGEVSRRLICIVSAFCMGLVVYIVRYCERLVVGSALVCMPEELHQGSLVSLLPLRMSADIATCEARCYMCRWTFGANHSSLVKGLSWEFD